MSCGRRAVECRVVGGAYEGWPNVARAGEREIMRRCDHARWRLHVRRRGAFVVEQRQLHIKKKFNINEQE